MAMFMRFTRMDGVETAINLDTVRQVVPSKNIGCSMLLFNYAMPTGGQVEMMEVKHPFSDLVKKIAPSNISIVQ